MSSSITTVYSYGGGKVLFYIFNAVAEMFSSGYINGLFTLSIIMGLAYVGINSIVQRNSFAPYIKWFMGYLVAFLVLLQPSPPFPEQGMTMHIKDVMTEKSYKVDHIPMGLVLPASFISTIAHNATYVFETFFGKPINDYLAYSQYGMLFGAQVRSEIKNMKIQNPILKENFENYISNCMSYDVMIGSKYNIHDLKNSDKIWDLLVNHSSNVRMFNFREGGFREPMTCKAGLLKLKDKFDDEAKLLGRKYSVFTSLGARGLSLNHNTSEKEGFLKSLEISNKFFAMKNISSADILRQILIINAFNDKPTSYRGANIVQNQDTMWHYSGKIGQMILPIIHAIFQAFVFASFPIVAIFMFFGFRFSSLKTYFQLMIWIELWPLLLAVLNGAVSVFMQEAGGFNQSITLASLFNLTNSASEYVMIAHTLGVFVPVFAYIVTKGGVGYLVRVVGNFVGSEQKIQPDYIRSSNPAPNISSTSSIVNNVNGGNVSHPDHFSSFALDGKGKRGGNVQNQMISRNEL